KSYRRNANRKADRSRNFSTGWTWITKHRFRCARPNKPECVTYQRSSSSSKSPAATERLCLVVSSLRAWSAIGETWFHSLRASCRFLSNFVALCMAGLPFTFSSSYTQYNTYKDNVTVSLVHNSLSIQWIACLRKLRFRSGSQNGLRRILRRWHSTKAVAFRRYVRRS